MPVKSLRLFMLWRLAVGLVGREILVVGVEQIGMPFDDEQVFSVFDFGLMREIEAARQQCGMVDQHNLAVGDGMLGIDER